MSNKETKKVLFHAQESGKTIYCGLVNIEINLHFARKKGPEILSKSSKQIHLFEELAIYEHLEISKSHHFFLVAEDLEKGSRFDDNGLLQFLLAFYYDATKK